ncbi:MAG: PBS lyase [Desulfotalea sp.]|nr:MAG: PBS lyase [Desulfotalea sp.]
MKKGHDVSDGELKKVIADFLEMGHIDNIVAMFRQEPKYYTWSGDILRDERFNVRLGLTVLFEELKEIQPEQLEKAVPSLLPLLENESSLLRGEAVSLLAIIDTPEAKEHIKSKRHDPSPQVREMVELVMEEGL